MELEQKKAIIEAILFSAGREVKITELMSALEVGSDDVIQILENMKIEYQQASRGMELIQVEDGYQLVTKKEYYDYLYPIFDKRSKPNLSQAAMETLSIIAYNPKITRAEIEAIRGVNSDGTMYKLLEYNLIQEVGRMDAPGRPTMYATTSEFLKMFGLNSLEELPELPRYKLDENEQIVLEEYIEEKGKKEEVSESEIENEAPMPEREEIEENEAKK